MVHEKLVTDFCATLQAVYGSLANQSQKLETERERFHQAHRYVNHWNAQQNEVVFIDVGGTRFHTTHSTITRHKDSMLSVLFSKRMQDNDFIFVDDDYVFIDRDPKFFHLVLQYLRYGTAGCYTPEEKECMNALLADASYYGLEGLRQQLEKRIWEQKRHEMEQLQRSLHRERAEREEEKQRHLLQEQLLQEQLRQTLLAKESAPEDGAWANDIYGEEPDSWNYEETTSDGYMMAAAAVVQHTAAPLQPAKQPPQMPKTPTAATPLAARFAEAEERSTKASSEFEHRFREQLKRTQELERVVQMSLVATPKQNQRPSFPKSFATSSPRASPIPIRSASPFQLPDTQPRPAVVPPRPASSLSEPRLQPSSPRRVPSSHHARTFSEPVKEYINDNFQMHSPPRISSTPAQRPDFPSRQRHESAMEVTRWQRHFTAS